jgi:hypothetical protein
MGTVLRQPKKESCSSIVQQQIFEARLIKHEPRGGGKSSRKFTVQGSEKNKSFTLFLLPFSSKFYKFLPIKFLVLLGVARKRISCVFLWTFMCCVYLPESHCVENEKVIRKTQRKYSFRPLGGIEHGNMNFNRNLRYLWRIG